MNNKSLMHWPSVQSRLQFRLGRTQPYRNRNHTDYLKYALYDIYNVFAIYYMLCVCCMYVCIYIYIYIYMYTCDLFHESTFWPVVRSIMCPRKNFPRLRRSASQMMSSFCVSGAPQAYTPSCSCTHHIYSLYIHMYI